MNALEPSSLQEVVGGSIAVLVGMLAWALRRLVASRPSNGERKTEADRLRREIRLALSEHEEFIALRAKLREVQDTSDDTAAKVRHIRATVTELQLRLNELEQQP